MDEPRYTFVTTTTYGSWLPGDARGFVQNGELLPASPRLERHAASLLKQEPVLFNSTQQAHLASEFHAACSEFRYVLCDLSIEAWHLHWIVRHNDTVASMVGRLKNRMRQRLKRGQIWTDGYWHRVLVSDEDLLTTRKYIRRHDGCRISDGQPVANPAK